MCAPLHKCWARSGQNVNVGRADELMTPDCVAHVGFARLIGPEGFEQLCAPNRAAFPDMHVTVHDLIAKGDRVVWRFTARHADWRVLRPAVERKEDDHSR